MLHKKDASTLTTPLGFDDESFGLVVELGLEFAVVCREKIRRWKIVVALREAFLHMVEVARQVVLAGEARHA
jgi:hypothetical protein